MRKILIFAYKSGHDMEFQSPYMALKTASTVVKQKNT